MTEASVSDLARACVPSPALARRRQDGDDDREAVDAFARDAEAHLVAIRARIERSGLESSIGLRASRREKTPRRLVEVIEDDDADAVVRDATASSESCAVLLACAAHGALRDGDAPSWSSRRASGAAAETYDAGSRSVSFTVVCFEETCEILFEALVSPKNAFGDEADEDEAAARVASRQLLWCLQRRELMDEDSARVVSTAVPCVLRAMDYPSDVVKTTGARCAREMTRRCELDWRATGAGAPLLHAAREALVGCTADVWPHALDVACALTHRLASGTPEVVEEFRKTFSRALECASLHGADASYAKPLLETFSSFVRVAKSCGVAHLNRLLPLLCRYMQSHKDEVAIGAAELLSVVVENSWPRARSYGASVWPDVKRAYAEADARSSKSCDDMRRALERACALVQLASGGTFSEVWNVDEEARRLSHCADLMTFLDSLPEVVREAE